MHLLLLKLQLICYYYYYYNSYNYNDNILIKDDLSSDSFSIQMQTWHY